MARPGLRILHVIPWLAPRYGGPAISVPQAAAALSRLGHSVEIVTTNVDGRAVLDVSTGRLGHWAGAAVTFHPLSTPRRYITSWPLLADLRRRVITFDLVHIHYLYRFHGVAAAAIARSRGVPYVVQPHGSLDPWHRNQKRRAKDFYHALVEDRIIRGAAAIVCTSDREQSYVRALGYRIPTRVVPIGIDVDELRSGGAPDFLKRYDIDPEQQVITFLGRISEKKGVPLLVDSFRLTARSFPRAHLLIAGPDEEGIGRALMPAIARLGLAGRVSFVGILDGPEKRALLQRSDVFVLPSEDESFGIAVAEAMAVGCPVVVSSEVALEALVRSSGCGIVSDRDPGGLAEAIGTILGSHDRASAMADAGRRAVDERFGWPVVAKELESMYEAIAGSRAQRAPSAAPAKP